MMDFKSFIGSMAQELRRGSSVSKALRRTVGRAPTRTEVGVSGDGFQAFVYMIKGDLDAGETAPRALRRAVKCFDEIFADQARFQAGSRDDDPVPF